MGERQFGPYRLVHQIAVGGMAEIHLAKTRGIADFEKFVALKMIHPNFSLDENFIEMLIDEAKISVQLQHVNIAQTFDLGRVDDTYYITMEFVDGADLYKLLRKASERNIQVPVDVAAFVAKEIANGLDYAHRKRDVSGQPLGIVHRDVSPQNVLISYMGEVKLVDFGIAKATMKARQTAVGVIKGKYYYMSPEQAWGDPVDHRTDIFSAGILLYEALVGQMLYLEDDLHRLLEMVRRADIAPPTTRRRDIPPQLERIVMHALAKNRDERYQSAGDMATDLERFLHVYSPVFSAAKLGAFFQQVLGDEPPPAAAPAPAPKVRSSAPPNVTMRLEPGQILSDSAEFADENSIIFDASDGMTQRGVGNMSADHVGMAGGGGGGDLFDSIEERTLVSGAPAGFGGPGISDDVGVASDFEPTLVGSGPAFVGIEERPMGPADGPTQHDQGNLDDLDDAPTLATDRPDIRAKLQQMQQQRQGGRPQAPPPRPPPSPPARRQTRKGAPAHPALAAKTPKPAVSELRQPRNSRKTPPQGVSAPGGAGGSLLSTLVNRDHAGAPVTRQPAAGPGAAGSGPGQPGPPGQPGQPPGQPGQPGAAPWNQQGPGAPGQPGGMPGGIPPGYQASFQPQQPGGAYGPGQPGPPGQPDPFAALPAGQMPTFTQQLRLAQDLEEVPQAYKIGRKRLPGWLLPALLVLVCVGVGAGLGVLLLGSNEVEASILIESQPSAATVSINGEQLPETTPTRYPKATPGTRYEIAFEKKGFRPKTEAVIIPLEGGEVRVSASLLRHRVTVEVSSTPKGAEIYLNNAPYGRTPKRISDLDPDVDYTLELRRKGYKPHLQKLRWGEDQTELSIDATLTK